MTITHSSRMPWVIDWSLYELHDREDFWQYRIFEKMHLIKSTNTFRQILKWFLRSFQRFNMYENHQEYPRLISSWSWRYLFECGTVVNSVWLKSINFISAWNDGSGQSYEQDQSRSSFQTVFMVNKRTSQSGGSHYRFSVSFVEMKNILIFAFFF